MNRREFVVLAIVQLALARHSGAAAAEPQHGIAMHGVPQLEPRFHHFPYVNPAAPKRGRLKLGALGTFDSLNPLIVMGVAAQGVREYVYESLLMRSADEPFTLYGLIAERIEVPDDRSSITFHLRSEAHFSDGAPITTADVLFSHAVLRDKGSPYFRSYYSKVVRAEAIGPHAVRFTFAAGGDREIPLILGLMPILPRHRLSPETFERTTLAPPVGSGPYGVSAIEAGRSILYRRDPNHWARDLPVYRGRFNFDEIRIDYFRDSTSLFEAFAAGQINVHSEDDPARWSDGYDFPAVKDGRVVKKEFKIGTPAGLSALVFNTRRGFFADARVRRALILLFDFEWINRSLYHGLYRRTDSLFARSELAAAGRPADDRERQLLGPFLNEVLPDVLEGRFRLPASDGSGNNRGNMRRAFDLLSEAGYRLEGIRLVAAETGQPLAVELLAVNRLQERLMIAFASSLKAAGISVHVRQVDNQQYWKRVLAFDFDMIQFTWAASLSPGNEQIHRWSSQYADTPNSLNFAGVKSPAADAMIGSLLAARSRADFTSAVRALDRVLMSGNYAIPLFHVPRQWIAHWRNLAAPERTPLTGTSLDLWWADAEE